MAGGDEAEDRRSTVESRLLELLWRPSDPERDGARISTVRIVEAGIALADADGPDAVSMRRVATSLGAAAMSLYTHVPDKSALVALMSDRVLLGMPVTEPPFGVPWRERLRLVADDNRTLLLRHPWLLVLQPSPAPLGPGLMAKYEWELAAFRGLGLSAVETDACLTLLLDYVRAATADLVAADAEARRRTAEGDRWWGSVGPVLERYVDEDDYPLATRIGAAAGGRDAGDQFRFGLGRVLDGISALVARGRS